MSTRARMLVLILAVAASLPSTAAARSHHSIGERPTPWDVRNPFTLPGGERVVGLAPDSGGAAALGEWTEVPRTWPADMGGGAFAYHAARDEILAFGGWPAYGDTWLWKDGQWRNPEPLLAPGGRAFNAMAYDPIRQEIVMFGGSEVGETWTWEGTAWTEHQQVGGPGRVNDAPMAWMPRIGKVVMFGGWPDEDGTQLDDTWAWDGSSWQRLVTPTTPPARFAPGLALDSRSGDLVMFGGLSDTYEDLGDTWLFDGTDWREVETDVAPAPRYYLSMATNPTVGAVELFGGYVLAESHGTNLSDRWWFVDGRWTQDLPGVEEGSLPTGRLGGGLVHDVEDGTMVLWGGKCDPTCGGVWTERLEVTEHLDGTVDRRLVWEETPSPWPTDRTMAGTLVEDPRGRGTLMHGGFGDQWGSGDPNDTWLWDGEWHRLHTDGAPPGRQGLNLAVHRPSRTVVLFGGHFGSQPPSDDVTWVLDGQRWEARTPATSPPGRDHAGMAEDPKGNVVLFGGYASCLIGSGGCQKFGDTWTWDGTTWTQHTSAVGPTARAYPHMAYDPVRKETVLFGGVGTEGLTLAETWVWDGEGWEQRLPPVSPPGRLGAAMAWDPASQRIVMFGGAPCAIVCALTDDLWTWDGTTWMPQASPVGGPSPRWFSMAGPAEDGIVLFGGEDAGTGSPFYDTWLWRSTV